MKKIFFFIFCNFFLLSCLQNDSKEITRKETSTNKGAFHSPYVPNSLSFCNEKFPLERQDIQESFDLEFIKNTYWHSNMILVIKRSARYFPIIEPILKEEGVPNDFKYLAVAESGLNPTISSPARAKGTWQFLSQTAKHYNLEISKDIDERLNVEKATHAACQYLKEAKEKFGSWTLAAASYNMGIGGLQKAINTQHTNDYFSMNLNPETNRYLFRIATLKYILNNPKTYGFELNSSDLYTPFKTKSITVTYPIKNLPNWAKEQGITYRELKFYNPWLTSTELTVQKGKSYKVQLPK